MNNRQQLSFSTKYFLRKSSHDDPERAYPIYIRVIFDRKKADISTRNKVKVSDWDEGKFRSKSDSLLNMELDKIESDIKEIYRKMVINEERVTAKRIRDRYMGKDDTEIELVPFVKEHIEEMKAQPDTYAGRTVKHYVTLLNHLINYGKYCRRSDLLLTEIDINYVNRFRHYLTTKKNMVTENNHKKLNVILNKAWELGYIPENPMRRYKYAKKTNNDIVYLLPEELKKIEELNGMTASVEKARDIFLFGCYTGLRYSDIEMLEPQHLVKENGKLKFRLQITKTGNPWIAPVLDKAKVLIDKYVEVQEMTGKLLPVVSNQKTNSMLKFIGELAGIEKRITMHVGRHTFATEALRSGCSLAVVGKWLGHASIKSTQVYAKVSGLYLEESSELLNKKMFK